MTKDQDYHGDTGSPGEAPACRRSASLSLTERLAGYFRSRPGEWIDGRALAAIAGGYAWRSRVSDIRRAPHFMVVSNRQRRIDASGKRITISEYRYMATATPARQPQGNNLKVGV